MDADRIDAINVFELYFDAESDAEKTIFAKNIQNHNKEFD